MRTKSYDVYKFEELSKEGQEKALEKMRDINVNYNWWDYSLEYWTEELDKLGFTDANINFSGFWSQGDGASFTAGIDGGKYIKANKLGKQFRSLLNIINKEWTVSGKVYRIDHHYSHEYTVSVSIESDYYTEDETRYNRIENQLQELQAYILEDVRTLSRKIYKELEKEYEYQTSDEQVKDTILANEYEFNERGGLE